MNVIGVALEELYRIFDKINRDKFEESLPTPVITIYPAKGKALGTFTLDKVWRNKNDIDEKTSEENACHEINIDPRWFDSKSAIDIVEILMHEMCHYCNKLNGIEDCKGKSHNKDFKNTAESIGLIVTKERGIGYGCTTLSDDLVAYVEDEIKPNEKAFEYFRMIITEEKKPKKKNLFKYTCPQCEMVVKGKKDCSIFCGTCQMELEMEDVEEDEESEE